jgi:hypothetical protein
MTGEVGTVGHGKVRLVVSLHGLLAGQHDAGWGVSSPTWAAIL